MKKILLLLSLGACHLALAASATAATAQPPFPTPVVSQAALETKVPTLKQGAGPAVPASVDNLMPLIHRRAEWTVTAINRHKALARLTLQSPNQKATLEIDADIPAVDKMDIKVGDTLELRSRRSDVITIGRKTVNLTFIAKLGNP